MFIDVLTLCTESSLVQHSCEARFAYVSVEIARGKGSCETGKSSIMDDQ